MKLTFGSPVPVGSHSLALATAELRRKLYELPLSVLDRSEILDLINDIETAFMWE